MALHSTNLLRTFDWHLVAVQGDVTVGVHHGMPVGEDADGELSFKPAHALLELETDGEQLVIRPVSSTHNVKVDGQDHTDLVRVEPHTSVSVNLPNNHFAIDTSFASAHSGREVLSVEVVANPDLIIVGEPAAAKRSPGWLRNVLVSVTPSRLSGNVALVLATLVLGYLALQVAGPAPDASTAEGQPGQMTEAQRQAAKYQARANPDLLAAVDDLIASAVLPGKSTVDLTLQSLKALLVAYPGDANVRLRLEQLTERLAHDAKLEHSAGNTALAQQLLEQASASGVAHHHVSDAFAHLAQAALAAAPTTKTPVEKTPAVTASVDTALVETAVVNTAAADKEVAQRVPAKTTSLSAAPVERVIAPVAAEQQASLPGTAELADAELPAFNAEPLADQSAQPFAAREPAVDDGEPVASASDAPRDELQSRADLALATRVETESSAPRDFAVTDDNTEPQFPADAPIGSVTSDITSLQNDQETRNGIAGTSTLADLPQAFADDVQRLQTAIDEQNDINQAFNDLLAEQPAFSAAPEIDPQLVDVEARDSEAAFTNGATTAGPATLELAFVDTTAARDAILSDQPDYGDTRIDVGAETFPVTTQTRVDAARPTPEEVQQLALNNSALGAAQDALNEASSDDLPLLYPLDRLKPVRRNPPVYPRRAPYGANGSVELELTLSASGNVDDATVRGEPAGYFARAAERAVRKWQFEPVLVDGKAVPVRTLVRLTFRG